MYAHPGQEADVHGLRVRPDARVELRPQPRLAPARPAAARRAAAVRPGPEPRLRVGAGAARGRLRRRRFPVDRLQRQREQRRLVHPPRAATAATSSSRSSTSRRSRATATASACRAAGDYLELVNSDGEVYGGGNVGNGGIVRTEPIAAHGHPQSLRLTLPALCVPVAEAAGGRLSAVGRGLQPRRQPLRAPRAGTTLSHSASLPLPRHRTTRSAAS